MKKLTVVILFVILQTGIFPIISLTANAQSGEQIVKKQLINPESFYYPIKRLIEKIQEKLLILQKNEYSFNEFLLKTRFAELDHVIKEKYLNEIEASSNRFSAQAGKIADITISLDNKKKKELITNFDEYNKQLEGLRDQHPANSSYWMLIQHNINTLELLKEKLK